MCGVLTVVVSDVHVQVDGDLVVFTIVVSEIGDEDVVLLDANVLGTEVEAHFEW